MSPAEFRKHGYAVIDWIADYLEAPEKWPVLPAVRPGDLRSALPQSPPGQGQSMEEILGDFQRLIVPAITHWNHPEFMAYFANSSTGAGILGEALTAALNVNAMLWRTSPAATELEQLTLDWLRQMLGLPDGLFGMIADTASSNTLYALAAAREMRPELRIREEGMSGRADLPKVVVYCSEEAHSSVDKAVMTLGLGLESLRKIPTDSEMRLDAGVARVRLGGLFEQFERLIAGRTGFVLLTHPAVGPIEVLPRKKILIVQLYGLAGHLGGVGIPTLLEIQIPQVGEAGIGGA
jgi:aromatic-L-amino-acid decarboxylase